MTIRPMRVALGQMDATIGDFAGNGAKIEAIWKEAEAAQAPPSDEPEGEPLESLRHALAEGTARQIDRAEHKRQQAAPGLRVSTKSFGSGRRIPIAQGSKA